MPGYCQLYCAGLFPRVAWQITADSPWLLAGRDLSADKGTSTTYIVANHQPVTNGKFETDDSISPGSRGAMPSIPRPRCDSFSVLSIVIVYCISGLVYWLGIHILLCILLQLLSSAVNYRPYFRSRECPRQRLSLLRGSNRTLRARSDNPLLPVARMLLSM